MKRVTIIVPAYHQTELSVHFTIQCLTAITKFTDPKLYKLIIVEDVPKHNIRDDFGVFKIDQHIILDKPTNYATKVNLAAKEVDTPYIAVIQNDCFVQEDWLEKFLYYFDKKKCQAMVPMQFGVSYEGMQEAANMTLDEGLHGGARDACMIFLTRKAFKKVKGFNEDLDAFVERDLYDRLAAVGISVDSTSKIHVTHIALGTHYQNIKALDRKMHHDGQLMNYGIKTGVLDRNRKPPAHKYILITGGSGSLGAALLDRLQTHEMAHIRVLSRSEKGQIPLKDKYPSVEFILGDVRDKVALKRALQGVDIVIHAAAFKFLDLAEKQTRECVETNVIGTLNLIEAIEELGTVDQCVGISTDKAVYARNAYGCTKHLMEKLFREANDYSKTIFSCVRYGNVLGTTGAVHTIWKKQFEANKPLTVTDERMRRFFFSVEEAVDLIMYALDNMQGGEIFTLKMPSYSIYDMAKEFAQYEGHEDYPIEVIGLRPGEKLNETLIADYEGQEFTSEQSGNNEVEVIR